MSGSYSNHKIELVLNSIEENQRLIDICSKKLEKDPTSKKALLLRANLHIKIEQFLKAEKDLTTLFTDPILCSTAYYLMGIIAKKQNKFEKSKQYLTLSIENDPNNVNALFLRGAILNLQGKFQEAINDYYLALEKDSLKNTRKNIYKNIEKILGINSCDENNESLSTNQHESVSSKTVGTNTITDLDYEINKNLNLILRKTSQLSPILRCKSEMIKDADTKNKAKAKQFLKDIDKYFYEKEENINNKQDNNYLNSVRDYKFRSKYNSSCGLESLNDSIGSNFSGTKMTYLNLNTQVEDNENYKGNSNVNHDEKEKNNNLFSCYQLETELSLQNSDKKQKKSKLKYGVKEN